MLLIHQTHQLWGTKCSRQDYKMAGLDPSIISNLKTPTPMSLGDIMGLATNAQAYKQAQQINPLAVRKQQAETDVSEQTAAPRISSAKSQASTAETGATSAAQTLAEKQQAGIANGFVNRIFDPLVTKAAKSPELLTDVEKQQLIDNTTEWGIKQGKELGIDADKASQLVQPYIDVATNNPGALQSYYKSRHIQGLTGSEQNVALTPSGPIINTNKETYGVNTNPFAGGVGQGDVIPGTQANMGLPPTTPVYNPYQKTTTYAADPNLQTKPAVGVEQLATVNASNFGKYQENLQNNVAAGNQVVQRTSEMKDLLSEFKPGAGSEVRMDIAKKLQAFGAPTTLVDAVAKGDLSAGQSFNKFIAQMVSSAAHQAGGTGAGVGEIDNYIKNNPDINTDPRALNRFIGFVEKQAARDKFELNALSEAQKDPNFKPENWINDYSKIAIKAGVMPRPVNPSGTTTQNQANTNRTVKRTGSFTQGKKTFKVIEYSDGSQEIKEAR